MPTYQTGQDYINKLRVVFSIMVAAPLLVFVIVFLMIENKQYTAIAPGMHDMGQYIAPILSIGLSLVAYIFYYIKIKPIRKYQSLRAKLDATYQLNIQKYIILLAAAVVALFYLIMTGIKLYAGISIAVYIIFAISNPVLTSIRNDLRLPKGEREAFLSNQEI